MKIAITGATGFIGRHLIKRHLELGDQVQIMSRKAIHGKDLQAEVKVFKADLLGDQKSLTDFLEGVDVLYHCAAEIKDESRMFEVNVEGTRLLCEAAKGKVKHWVQLSSTGVYGPVLKGIVVETQKLNPVNTYEKSKVESDKIVISAGRNNYFTYSILRPSNVFGIDMRNQSLYQLIKAVDRGMFFFIGDDKANANYVPVENVVEALVLVATNGNAKGKIYNISDVMTLTKFISIIAANLGKQIPSLRIPKIVMQILGVIGNFIPKSPLTSGRVDALTNKVIYPNNLIEVELGYTPVISFVVAIENLVNAYKKQI